MRVSFPHVLSMLAGCLLGVGTTYARPPAPASPAAVAASPAPTADEAIAGTGRELTRLFLDRDTDAVWARFSPQMRQAMQDADALAEFRRQLDAQLGQERSLVSEETALHQGAQVYLRVARYSRSATPIRMQWAFDAHGEVLGFFVQPVAGPSGPAESAHLDRDTRADLRLPFSGDWYVFWGGRTLEQNYHAVDAGQRFAYDFVKRVDGSSHRGDGSRLEDYHCWNEPILAPAAGTVVEAVDGLPDQAIGTTDPTAPAGNHVVLDLGQGEYALLAHLRQDSVTVAKGDRVEPGETLGRCGNSGNTGEPHLHFHLQDAPVFGQGAGLPAFFNGYRADGVAVTRGEPVRGQTVGMHEAADAP